LAKIILLLISIASICSIGLNCKQICLGICHSKNLVQLIAVSFQEVRWIVCSEPMLARFERAAEL